MPKPGIASTILITLFIPPLGIILIWWRGVGSLALRLAVTIASLVFFRKLLVLYMIAYGKLVFPEASDVLRHYCFGDGSRLVSTSDYFRRSPVILAHLKTMKTGEIRKIRMHQWEDYRLTYCLNPCTIQLTKEKVILTQWMAFDRTGNVNTMVGPFAIPDNIAHVFDCTPYLFYHEFDRKDIDFDKADPPNLLESYYMGEAARKGWRPGGNYKRLQSPDTTAPRVKQMKKAYCPKHNRQRQGGLS
jgi:hypothetical protein